MKKTINKSVQEAVEEYLQMMGDEPVSDLYEMVLAEVEAPLLRSVLGFTKHNQSQTAEILGLNRGTLRKKLRKYHLL
ncbi:MAG: helix-turn-helix domain-containing protein [Candidatus Azotimanducaceae bacterium WSBS_2022_MAG_OTU7]